MPGFTIDTETDCCCPEMRCCVPEVVYATVGGMGGTQLMPGDGPWGDPTIFSVGACGSWVDPCFGDPQTVTRLGDGTYWYRPNFLIGYDEEAGASITAAGLDGFYPSPWGYWVEYMLISGCSVLYEWNSYEDCVPGGACIEPQIWAGTISDSPWHSYCFMNATVTYYWAYESCSDNNSIWPIVISVGEPGRPLCDDFPYVCTKPSGAWYAGPNGGVRYATCESDLNGNSIICTRPDQSVTPEIRASITRSNTFLAIPDHGIWDAQLLYEVQRRRGWVWSPSCGYVIDEFGVAQDGYSPPENQEWSENDEYCIDYRCSPRSEWFPRGEPRPCGLGFCTAHVGLAKPHLYAESESGNQTAEIKLIILPETHEGDASMPTTAGGSAWGRFPIYYRVGGAEILDGGFLYSVGDFFRVIFDFVNHPQLGGEIHGIFPTYEPNCGPPFTYDYLDAYGYQGELVPGAFDPQSGKQLYIQYQRFRVSEVDEESGSIKSLELVPWRRNPERYNEVCWEDNSPPRRDWYPLYTRLLCHAQSVHFGGKGYTRYDQINFSCDDPACTVVRNATARVEDVDDDGAILDWKIDGSDSWRIYDPASCFSGDYCCPDNEPDNRGIYLRTGKNLCSLTWSGIGAPVRRESMNGGCGMGVPMSICGDTETYCQTSLTPMNLTITRVQCETALEILSYAYPYEATSPLVLNNKARGYWKPYPRNYGGGAVIEPVFGEWGSNESSFGAGIEGATIHSRGAGYCFRDKIHVEPILPKAVPSPPEPEGSPAVLGEFSFSARLGFPNPLLIYATGSGQEYAIASNRFAYFEVTGVDIEDGGSGYSVGFEFSIQPDGGAAYADAWAPGGGDDPEACPNGGWYAGRHANLNSSGFFPMTGFEETSTRNSFCTLRVSEVGTDGEILALEVVNPGLMFRAVWAEARQHPDLVASVDSTLGYGAYAEATFNLDYGSLAFGTLQTFQIVPSPPISEGGLPDPLHDRPNNRVVMPTGGRDYADPGAGWFWRLENITVGNGSLMVPWALAAYAPWNSSRIVSEGQHLGFAYNALHPDDPEWSPYDVAAGAAPPFVPPSTVCHFDDCYHSLLNRSYTLYRLWSSVGNAPPVPVSGLGSLPHSWAMLKPRNKIFDPCNAAVGVNGFAQSGCAFTSADPIQANPNAASGIEMIVAEWGPTLSLSHEPSCPDHSDGSTYAYQRNPKVNPRDFTHGVFPNTDFIWLGR